MVFNQLATKFTGLLKVNFSKHIISVNYISHPIITRIYPLLHRRWGCIHHRFIGYDFTNSSRTIGLELDIFYLMSQTALHLLDSSVCNPTTWIHLIIMGWSSTQRRSECIIWVGVMKKGLTELSLEYEN